MSAEEYSNKKRQIRPSKDVGGKSVESNQQDGQTTSKLKSAKTNNKATILISSIFRPISWVIKHLVPRYIRNAFAELRQVTWPNRKQSRQLTSAVVLFSIVFGFLVATLDYGLDKVFKKVFLKE